VSPSLSCEPSPEIKDRLIHVGIHHFFAEPGSAILRCWLARTPAGVTLAAADCTLFLNPLTTSPTPFVIASNPAAGIRQQGVNLSALHGRIKLVHTFGCRKISLKGFHLRAIAPERGRRLLDLRFVRRDQKVVAFICAALRQFKSDAGGRTGDNRERSGSAFQSPVVASFES
jgi:hypothetical protein